jgi:hypothetical protein
MSQPIPHFSHGIGCHIPSQDLAKRLFTICLTGRLKQAFQLCIERAVATDSQGKVELHPRKSDKKPPKDGIQLFL